MRLALLAALLVVTPLVAIEPIIEFEMKRMEGLVGSSAGEKPSDPEGWYQYWHGQAVDLESKGQLRQAAAAHLSSVFFLFDRVNDTRIREAVAKSRSCLQQTMGAAIKQVAIPYEGTTLPGYLGLVAGEEKRPIVILHSGFDGCAEELVIARMDAILQRGFHCLIFDGPGQGRVIVEQGLPFRPDWEVVIKPVVDFVEQLPQVDTKRIALWGESFGGHLATRAAAFEPRITALVSNGGIYDFYAHCLSHGSSGLDKQLDEPRALPLIDRAIGQMMRDEMRWRWFFGRGMETFAVSSPSELLRTTRSYKLQDVISKVRCPVLIVDSEDDFLVAKQPRQLFDALAGPKEYMLFGRAEGASAHCQAGAYGLSNGRILDWLDTQLNPPNYLYKLVKADQWKESQGKEQVMLGADDTQFIHLAKEDQIQRVAQKFYADADYLVLKLDTRQLAGRLVCETNPGGTSYYYHLYDGQIPLKAVIESKIVKKETL